MNNLKLLFRMAGHSCCRMRIVCSIILVVFLLGTFSIPIYAGVAAGSGGGADVPLHLRDCSLTNGQKDVPTDVQITLYYSHNVADAAVQKNNTAAIHMASSAGKSVSLTVSYSSVFEYRQEIYVKPSGLLPDTTYVLTIDPSLMSRNGYTTGTTDTITFTTEKQSESTNSGSSNSGTGSSNQSDKTGTSQPSGGTQSSGTSGAQGGGTPAAASGIQGSGSSGTQSTGSASQKQNTTVNAAAGASGSSLAGAEPVTEQGTAAAGDVQFASEDYQTAAEDIEEEKLQEALDAGIVEETDEIEIVKVSDKKPGRVEQTETVAEFSGSESVKTRAAQNTVILVVVAVVIAGVGIGLLYYRMKKHGKSV